MLAVRFGILAVGIDMGRFALWLKSIGDRPKWAADGENNGFGGKA